MATTKERPKINKEFKEKRNAVAKASKELQVEKLDDMLQRFPEYLEGRAIQFSRELADYVKKNGISGEVMPEEMTKIPLIELTQHTFQPVIKVAGVSPKYSADQLAIAFDFYAQCTLKINQKYIYIPKIADFCRMLNISTHKFKEYKETSTNEEIREVCYMIEDFCSSIVDDAAFHGRIERTYAIFHQKFSNSKRDNDPISNNTFIQYNNIMSEKEINDLMKKYITT